MATGANTDQKLEKINGVIAQAIHRVYTKDVRAVLDEQLHFIPLDFKTISLTLASKLDTEFPSKDINALYQEILDHFTNPNSGGKIPIPKKLFMNGIGTFTTESGTIIDSELKLKEKVSEKSTAYKYLSALVYNGDQLVGVLAPNFDTASRRVVTEVFNAKLKSYLRDYSDKLGKDGKVTSISKGFDLGHIYSSVQSQGIGSVTPSTEKAQEVISEIERSLNNISDIGQREKLESMLKGINSRFDTLKRHSTYAPEVFLNIDKSFQDASLKIGLTINVVIPQDRYENQGIYAALYEGPMIRYILEELKTMNFSRNLVEEIATRVAHAIKGVGTKGTKSSLSSKSKTSVLNVVGKKPTIGALKVAPQSKQRAEGLPSFSLTSLQNLLDAQLQHVIAANMGNGQDKRILNYRTGRFAASAKVERLSMSKEGAITAFYSYMRNPYGTFSQGGAQQFPKTRDPKLLISQSIREIAATKVANRLRAVLV